MGERRWRAARGRRLRARSRRSSATPPTTRCCATRCWRTCTASSSTRWKRRRPTSSCSRSSAAPTRSSPSRIGRSRSHVTNTIRLLELPPRCPAPGRRRGAERRPRPGAAGAATTPAAQERLAQRIVAEGLSVRAVEELVTLGETGTPAKAARRRRKPQAPGAGRSLAEPALRPLRDPGQGRARPVQGQDHVEFASVEDLERDRRRHGAAGGRARWADAQDGGPTAG